MSHTKSDNYIQVCMRAVEQARLKDMLQYVLTNLDTENMSDTLRSKLQGL